GDRLADLGAGVVRAGCDGATRGRVQASSLRARSARSSRRNPRSWGCRVRHRRELRDNAAAHVAERRVRDDLGPVVRAGEVERQVAAVDVTLQWAWMSRFPFGSWST